MKVILTGQSCNRSVNRSCDHRRELIQDSDSSTGCPCSFLFLSISVWREHSSLYLTLNYRIETFTDQSITFESNLIIIVEIDKITIRFDWIYVAFVIVILVVFRIQISYTSPLLEKNPQVDHLTAQLWPLIH